MGCDAIAALRVEMSDADRAELRTDASTALVLVSDSMQREKTGTFRLRAPALHSAGFRPSHSEEVKADEMRQP
jgi:hypothetical protein